MIRKGLPSAPGMIFSFRTVGASPVVDSGKHWRHIMTMVLSMSILPQTLTFSNKNTMFLPHVYQVTVTSFPTTTRVKPTLLPAVCTWRHFPYKSASRRPEQRVRSMRQCLFRPSSTKLTLWNRRAETIPCIYTVGVYGLGMELKKFHCKKNCYKARGLYIRSWRSLCHL